MLLDMLEPHTSETHYVSTVDAMEHCCILRSTTSLRNMEGLMLNVSTKFAVANAKVQRRVLFSKWVSPIIMVPKKNGKI